MSVERNLIISILKLTKEGPAALESIALNAKIPSEVTASLLERLQDEDMIHLNAGNVEADNIGRIELAVKAAHLGADVQRISDLLRWQEFEEIGALALRNNGFTVHKNVRFKHAGRRWEIDVVGCKKPLVVCIDCKHWQHAITPSELRKIVDLQVQRTHALADLLPAPNNKLDCIKWDKARFIPAVLSLIPSADKFINETPVVPVLQLQDFIHQLPGYLEFVKYFPKTFKTLSHDFKD